MLIRKKLIIGSLGIALFIILVSSIVLIDSNETLSKTIQLTNECNIVNSSIIEAQEAEKYYFLFKKGLIRESDISYLEKFRLAIDKAKESAKRDKKITGLLDDYSNYFEGIVAKGKLNDASIKTLRTKGENLKKIASEKVIKIQEKSESTKKRIYSTLLIAFILVGVASVGGGIFLSRLVTLPIGKLVDDAKRISEGDLNHKIEIITQDEIADLASIINKISEDLNHAKQDVIKGEKELEIKLTRQTNELKDKQEKIIESERRAAVEQLANAVSSGLTVRLRNLRTLIYQLKGKIPKVDKIVVLEVKNVLHGIDHIVRITNNITAYFNPPVLNLEPADINKMIEEILSLSEEEGVLENIKVVRRLNPEIPRIPLDIKNIKQVFDNLFTNACQSMPEGGELIIATNSGSGEIEVKISDSGTGIVEENLRKIFTSFFTTRSEGLGLGLTVVRENIKKHRGTIAIQSTVGKGTTCIIKLPI